MWVLTVYASHSTMLQCNGHRVNTTVHCKATHSRVLSEAGQATCLVADDLQLVEQMGKLGELLLEPSRGWHRQKWNACSASAGLCCLGGVRTLDNLTVEYKKVISTFIAQKLAEARLCHERPHMLCMWHQ